MYLEFQSLVSIVQMLTVAPMLTNLVKMLTVITMLKIEGVRARSIEAGNSSYQLTAVHGGI